jgi:hypothetical protein
LRVLAGVFSLVVMILLAGGCRYPLRGASWVDKKADDLAYLGEGDEFAQPGLTEAEVRRKHERAERLDWQMMWSDLDRALMLDRPSRLTDRRIP